MRTPPDVDGVEDQLPPPRDRIIAPEVPSHRDHLALALVASLLVALAGAGTIVMVPRPPNDVRYLERARAIRTLAVEERERRRAMKPLVVPMEPRRPQRDPLLWAPGSSVAEAIRIAETKRAERESCDVNSENDLGWEVIIDAQGTTDIGLQRTRTAASKTPPRFVCRAPDRDAARAWFEVHVQPVLSECMQQHLPSSEVHSALTLAFDELGRVSSASFTDVVHVNEEAGDVSEEDALFADFAFIACAEPRMAELTLPDAYELTLTWPFVLLP